MIPTKPDIDLFAFQRIKVKCSVRVRDKEFREKPGIAMFTAYNVGAAMFAVKMKGVDRKPNLLEKRILLSKEVIVDAATIVVDEEFWH